MKVKDFCLKHKAKSYYFIPKLVNNRSITPREFDVGMGFQKSFSAPTIISEAQVLKAWYENEEGSDDETKSELIIIWDNSEYDSEVCKQEYERANEET